MSVILGLDLSLRATGIVVVPASWGLNWSNVYAATCGNSLPKTASTRDKAKRLISIRNTIRAVVQSYKPTHCTIENYAFRSPFGSEALAELGGVVKVLLVELDLPFEAVMPASARRLFGKQPKKDPKIWAASKLYAAGAPKKWTLDMCDAFTMANWKLADFGAALMLEPGAA